MSNPLIKVLSLLNGQELVGVVTANHAGKMYTITDPLIVVPQQGQSQNQMGFGFMPWPIFGVDSSYDIDMTHVVVSYQPRKEVLDGYTHFMEQLSASKSGLVVPSKPRLIIE